MSSEMNSNTMVSDSPSGISTFKKIVLGVLFFVLLLFFTLTKLPEAKITSLIQGYMQSTLDPYGIYISDHGREFSVWKGFQYKLNQPTLELPDQSRVDLEQMIVTPNLMSLLTAKVGADVIIKQAPNSELTLKGTIRGDLVDATIHIQDLDLGKFGVFAFIGALKGNGQITGDIHVDGHLADLSSLSGYISLKIRKLKLDEQNLFGFQLPTILVNEGSIDAMIDHGKVVMKNVQIGKGSDDLQLGVSGDITLNKNLNASLLNIRTVLGLSDKLKQSLSLLDSIMGQGKQPDGKYVYKLTGTFSAPHPHPESQK